MAGLTNAQLLTLAQTAQRQGLSRGGAWKTVRGHVTRDRWVEIWATARRVEAAFPPLNVVRPEEGSK